MTVKNLSSAVNAYRYNTELTERKSRTAKKSASGRNVDKFDFSGSDSAAGVRRSFAESLRTAAKSAADSAASPERIKALTDAVRSGSYSVSDEELADSVLGL